MKGFLLTVDKKWELPITLTILFLGALVIRFIAILQTHIIAHDSILYLKTAQLYYAGNFHDALLMCQFSVLPLFLSYVYRIVGDWVTAGQLFSTFCGALTVIPLFLLARRIFDSRVALYGAILYILCPNLVQYSAEVLRDIPFIFFYVSALWLAYTGIKDKNEWHLALSGIFATISISIRREGILLLIIVLLYLIWKIIEGRVSWKKSIILLSSFLLPLICIFVLFGFFTKDIDKLSSLHERINKEWVISSAELTIKNIEKEVNEKNLSTYGRNFFQLAKQYRFSIYLSHIIYKAIKVFTILMFFLFLFGLIRRKKIEYRNDEFLLASIWVIFIIAFLFHLNNTNYFSTRYPFPVVVPSLIWSGVGFLELKERIFRWIKPRNFPLKDFAVRWGTLLLIIVIGVPLLVMALTPQRKDKLELKEIGLWLRDHGYSHSIIVGQYEFTRLAFYADGEFIELPKGSYQNAIKFASEKAGDLLVINMDTIDHLSPGFLDKISPRDLQRIDIPGIQIPKYATTVFRIRGEEERK